MVIRESGGLDEEMAEEAQQPASLLTAGILRTLLQSGSDVLNLGEKSRHMLLDDVPDFLHVHTVISMDQNISETGHSAPRDIGVDSGRDSWM
jgi:hypothetical protein